MGIHAAFFRIASNGQIGFIRRINSNTDILYCKGIAIDPSSSDHINILLRSKTPHFNTMGSP